MKRWFTLWLLVFGSFGMLGAQAILMQNGTVNTCSGFFQDSGGGNGDYGNDENYTLTLCSDGTSGTHVQLTFNNVVIAPGDELCFYDGTDTSAPLLACASEFGSSSAFIIQATAANPGGCLTITFVSDDAGTGAGWSAAIECIPSCQTILAQLDSTLPAAMPADTGWIDICPGDRVFFWGSGQYPQNGVAYNHSDFTSTFEWDFGDGTFGVGPNVTHVYDEPGGYIVQLTITDQFGCRNTNFISQRVRVSTRPQFVSGREVPQQICVGDSIELNAMVNLLDSAHNVSVAPTEGSFLVQGVRSDSLPLPDGDGTSYMTSITFTDFAPGQVLTDINDLLGICVNMEHSWMRDLQISIECPNGTSVILHDHPGQVGGEVFLGEPFEADEGLIPPIPGVGYDYCWTPNAPNPTWIQYANMYNPQTLPPGDYSSYEPLENLIGCPLNGEWTITVQDLWAIDNGYIFSWGINFNPDLYPSIETFTPQIVSYEWLDHPSIFFMDQDSIAASPQSAGTASYTFRLTDDFGCAWDTMFQIQVLPQTHPDCRSCTQLLTPQPDTSICVGESVALDATGYVQMSDTITFEAYPNAEFNAGDHPANNPLVSEVDVNSIFPLSLSNPQQQLVRVCVDIETDFASDIRMRLRAPDGTVIPLAENVGGSGDDFKQTCFVTTPFAPPISSGSPPFTGNFAPQGNWTDLAGAPTNGKWALLVSDDFGLTTNSLLRWWSISFIATNDISYLWSPITDLSCFTCPDPVATPMSDATYVVSAVDNYGCAATDTVQLFTFGTLPAPEVSCFELVPGTLQFDWTDVVPGYSYQVSTDGVNWEPPNNGPLSHVLSGIPSGASATLYVRAEAQSSFCGVETGEASCLTQCQLFADQDAASKLEVSCAGACDAVLDLNVYQSYAPLTYVLRNLDDGTQTTYTEEPITGLCAGNYALYVSDLYDCADTLFFAVTEPEPIVATWDVVENLCYGDSAAVISVMVEGGTAPWSYLWNTGHTASKVGNLPQGTYLVTVTDAHGCTWTQAIEVTDPPPLEVELETADITCYDAGDGQIRIIPSGGTPPYDFEATGNGIMGHNLYYNLNEGAYAITVWDANDCRWQGTATIHNPPPFTLQVQGDTAIGSYFEIELADSILLLAVPQNAQGEVQYTWHEPWPGTLSCDSCAATWARPFYTIRYRLSAVDAQGCYAETEVEVRVLKERLIAVPTGFTPNGDGRNDLLEVFGQTGTEIVRFEVFDRWGERVFEATDFPVNTHVGWDGTFRGMPAMPGVYIWYIEARFIDGYVGQFRGQTTLIR